jgi:hypothetical protein
MKIETAFAAGGARPSSHYAPRVRALKNLRYIYQSARKKATKSSTRAKINLRGEAAGCLAAGRVY